MNVFFFLLLLTFTTASNDYTNVTICIKTRDNVCLSTTIFTPPLPFKSPYSVLYAKTPYGKEGALYQDAYIALAEGWVFMAQDTRGRGDSNGTYSFFRTSGNDSLDTFEWILNQTWSNGQIGGVGASANALSQYADIVGVTIFEPNTTHWNYYNDIYQHLRILQLFCGNGMGYHTVFQGGAYREGFVSTWLQQLNETSMITTILENEAFTQFWYSLSGPYQSQWNWINQSIIHFAGFYDVFSTPQILTALHLNQSGQHNAKGQQILIIDPGGHCVKGNISWPNDFYGWETVELYGLPAANAAFEYGLNNNISNFNIHDFFPFNVLWYQLGPGTNDSIGNFWVKSFGFPESIQKILYLTDNMLIDNVSNNGNKSYIYNPMNPVETYGGNNFEIKPCGPWDQNVVENGRNDILKFQSSILTDHIAILGMIRVDLFVSSNCVDTDFSVKLIDVFPNGDSYLVQDSIYRMRWRNGAANGWLNYSNKPAEFMINGNIYNISIDIGFMSYIFNPNHRIAIHVSSSNYPRFSVNYNSGYMVINGSISWKNATNTIYWGNDYLSQLVLPVVDLQWLQKRRATEKK